MMFFHEHNRAGHCPHNLVGTVAEKIVLQMAFFKSRHDQEIYLLFMNYSGDFAHYRFLGHKDLYLHIGRFLFHNDPVKHRPVRFQQPQVILPEGLK